MIYNSYILPNNVTSDSYFLRYEFVEALLDALGIKDESGVIYELIQYRYFEDQMLGDWELMIDSMVNVRNSFTFIIKDWISNVLSLACWNIFHQGLNIWVYEI